MRAPTLAVLLLVVTLSGCGSSDARDSDGDGIPDQVELDGWGSQIIELMDRRVLVAMSSDPFKADTDGDGLDDGQELALRTDPRNPDTDGDGLTDCQEAFHTVKAECEDPDFDAVESGDGGTGTDPRKADSDPGPSRYKMRQPFTDETGTLRPGEVRFGDGLSDGLEWNGYNITLDNGRVIFVRSDVRNVDSDGDGLEDAEERIFRGDPWVEDTDGDGCLDGQDPWPSAGETYVFQPLTLRLDNTPSGNAAEVRFTIQFLDQILTVPATGTIRAQPGQDVDLRDHAIRQGPQPCRVGPLDPVSSIQVAAYDQAGQTGLDLTSKSVAPALEWNVRTGIVGWQGGDEASVPVQVSGRHGRLTFDAFVEGL